MTRTRKLTLKLLREIISQHKLKGGLESRTAAIKCCVDLLALVRMNVGREWVRGDRSYDSFVGEQRRIAGDTKIGPGLRADACRRLVVLGGFAPATILFSGDRRGRGADSAADEYTERLVASSASATKGDVSDVSDFIAQLNGKKTPESVEEVLERLGGV